jgi:ABC-2 type transport system permease protein
MKQILSLMGFDFANARKDTFILYIVLSPILLAVAVAIFVPKFGGTELKIVVTADTPAPIVRSLEEYADVEEVAALGALERRIQKPDDAAGIYYIDGEPVLLLAGDESDGFKQTAEAVAGTALQGEEIGSAAGDAVPDLHISHRQVGEKRSNLREYMTLMLLMLSSLIGGMTVGFNIVDEKSNKVNQCLAVSPVRIGAYITAKTAFTGFISLIISLATVFIIKGFRLPYGYLLPALIVSTLVAAVFGFILGRFADTQIAAIGMIKILMPVYLTIPVIAIFVPGRLGWVFSPFPQYWLFSLYHSALIPEGGLLLGFWPAFGIYMVESVAALFIVSRLLKNHLGLR